MQTDPSLSKSKNLKMIEICIVDDYRIVFERKCPFELNLVDADVVARVGHEIISQEDLIVKILVKVNYFFIITFVIGYRTRSWRNQSRDVFPKRLFLPLQALVWSLNFCTAQVTSVLKTRFCWLLNHAGETIQLCYFVALTLQVYFTYREGQHRQSFLQSNFGLQDSNFVLAHLRGWGRGQSQASHQVQTQNGPSWVPRDGVSFTLGVQGHSRQEPQSGQTIVQVDSGASSLGRAIGLAGDWS